MAKARGNKLVPPANYSRNPMTLVGEGRSAPLPPGNFGVYRQNDPFFVQGTDQKTGQSVTAPISGRQYAGFNNPFNWEGPLEPTTGGSIAPVANRDVLARAASALNAVQQDRQNPVPYGRPVLPMSIASQPNRFVGPMVGMSSAQQTPVSPPSVNIWNTGRQVMSPDPGYAARQAQSMQGQSHNMRELAGQIDSLRQRSQSANPMVPNSPLRPVDPGVAAMQQGIDLGNTQANIMMTPGAGSSLGAARNFRRIQPESLNATTAGTVNSYNGNLEYATNPMRLDPETKFNLANANARRMVGGGAASDPTNIGGRFGGAYGSNLEADATAIAEGRAVRTADGNVVYHTGTPESARAAYLSARQNNYGRTPEQERARSALAQQKEAERAARHQAFKDATGGMNYKQYDRLQRQNALTMKAVDEGRLSPEAANFRMQTRADKALRRAGNPMAMGDVNRGRLFPDMLAGRGGRAASPAQNPMLAAFEPGAQNTPEGNALRDQMKVELAQSSPSLSAMGVAPDADPNTFAGSIAAYDGDLTDEGLTEIHNFAKTFMGGQDGSTPFDNAPNMMAAPEMLAELWKLPIGTSPQKLREWYNKYRQETKARLDKAKQNMQSSPAWTVG